MNPPSTLATLLLVALSLEAGAQSADNFQPPATTPKGEAAPDLAQEVQIEELDKETESALMAEPSRYAGLDTDHYVQALSSSFSMRNRDIDPFARHQDPNFKPIQPKITKKKARTFQKEPVIAFSEVVSRVNITAVMAAQQTFLVNGGRSFTIGDRINLDVGKEKFLAIHVVRIQKNRVTFRHSITGETADKTLGARHPNGIVPKGLPDHGSLPPGLADASAPLDARPNSDISSRR